MRNTLLASTVAAAVLLAASEATAQTSGRTEEETRRLSGWSVTPALGYSGVWDDNPLVRGTSDLLPADFTNAINPSLAVQFISRRSEFGASYDGTLVGYREL